MILRLLNPQGIAGLAAALVLALLLVAAKIDGRHWHKQSAHYEQLYREGAAALDVTVANVRAATATAEAADRAAVQRAESLQHQINERSADALETRLADARARAQRLRFETPASPAIDGSRQGAAVPGLPGRAPGLAQAAGETGFPPDDRLIATEQAIQLDELIKWVQSQSQIRRDREPPPGQ